MPYVTRDMANFVREKEFNSVANEIKDNNDDNSSGGSNYNSTLKSSIKRKLRELPTSVIPISIYSEDESSLPTLQTKRQHQSKSDYKKSLTKSSNPSSSSITPSLSCASSAVNSKKLSSNNQISSEYKKSSRQQSFFFNKYENPNKNLSFNEKEIKYTIGLLRSNITKLNEFEGIINVERSREFRNYKIDFDTPLIEKPQNCDLIVKVVHRNEEFKMFPLCCKVYDLTRRPIDPQKSEYLKILRSLARKHPSIVQTWAVFYDQKKQHILVIQEYFFHGSAESYLDSKKHECYPENKTSEIAQQLALAMDFLGDMGISHRSLSPRHIMIAHREPIRVKLSGFRSALIYWDLKHENVNLVPCIPLANKPEKPEFQAPEVYGDSETEAFDPIHADIWSFGACIYYFLTKKYPYDFTKENPQMEEEIQNNVRETKTSIRCQNFLTKILCTNAEKRMKFDRLTNHPWIMR